MSTRRERIEIEITADSRDAGKELDKTGKKFDTFKSGVDKAAKGAAVAAGGLLAIGAASLSSARDAERATTTINRVFGDSADTLKSFSDDAAENVGVSTAAYETMAAQIGESLKGMGLDTDTAARKTDELLTVAGDMALALGTDVPAATDALGAALRGEFDALSEFGVKVDDASIKAGLAAKGISGPEGMDTAAYNAAYQQELLNQVLGTAGQVYGGYRAETDTTAEKQDTLTAKWDDAATKLGDTLLPAIGWVADKLIELVDWVDKNKDTIIKWLPYLGAAAAAVWVLNIALAANPIVLVTVAIIGLIAVMFYFRNEIDTAGRKVDEFMSVLDNIIPGLGPVRWAFELMSGDVARLYGLVSALSSAVQTLIGWWDRLTTRTVGGLPVPAPRLAPAGFADLDTMPAAGRAMLDADAAAAPARRASLGTALSSLSDLTAGPGVTVINVTGALDPDSVARQIDSILRRRQRRTGPVITL